MLDDDGNPLIDEPETPTEKLRRLRYEAQELEEQLEAEAAEKAKAREAAGIEIDGGDGGDGGESEYEPVDDLPRRDDADKTKPPPSRRRRKKPQADANGELSPAVLLKQLKRLRSSLSGISISESIEDSSNEMSSEARSKDLLRKLSQIRSHTFNSTETVDGSETQATASPTISSLSQFDTRLDLLEKYVGTNEADVDEVCTMRHSSMPLFLLSVPIAITVTSSATTFAC